MVLLPGIASFRGETITNPVFIGRVMSLRDIAQDGHVQNVV